MLRLRVIDPPPASNFSRPHRPDEVIDGVLVRDMVGVLQSLELISDGANQIFESLTDLSTRMAQRIHRVGKRAEAAADKLVAFEKELATNSSFSEQISETEHIIEWSQKENFTHNLFTPDTRPAALQLRYQKAKQLPNITSMSEFSYKVNSQDGKRVHTNPLDYYSQPKFFEQWWIAGQESELARKAREKEIKAKMRMNREQKRANQTIKGSAAQITNITTSKSSYVRGSLHARSATSQSTIKITRGLGVTQNGRTIAHGRVSQHRRQDTAPVRAFSSNKQSRNVQPSEHRPPQPPRPTQPHMSHGNPPEMPPRPMPPGVAPPAIPKPPPPQYHQPPSTFEVPHQPPPPQHPPYEPDLPKYDIQEPVPAIPSPPKVPVDLLPPPILADLPPPPVIKSSEPVVRVKKGGGDDLLSQITGGVRLKKTEKKEKKKRRKGRLFGADSDESKEPTEKGESETKE
mmetsp:Transcript_9348/g.14973  ORF Transcript_9348/g.14973 Transcript_9348/m.14973 type:complete len:459 (-) Transcript_9348:263-1639(-)